MASQAFKVITGVTQIASSASSKTLTEGVDYTLPAGADATNCFVRIANTRHCGMGRTDTVGDHNTEDFGVWITGSIGTSITFNRAGSPAYNCEVRYEILCYIGASGGPNEFIVREVGTVSGTGQTLTGSTVTTISDVDDCVLFLTGQGHDDNDSLYWNEMLFSGELVLNGSDYDPTFSRLEAGQHGTSGATISYAVVEWVGSNWTVDRWSTDSYAGTIWSATTNSYGEFAHGITIADINKACIIEAQYAGSDTPCVTLHAGDALMLYDGTNIRCWRRASSETHRNTAWILQNSQASGDARNFNCQKVQYRDDSLNVSDPRDITVDLTTDPDISVNAAAISAPLDETSIVGTASDNDSGTWYPRGGFNYWIAGTDEIHYKMNNDDTNRRVAFEIIEWPEDEVADPLNVVQKSHTIITDPGHRAGTPWA